LYIANSTRSAWKTFQEYWWVIQKFAESGRVERKYLITRGLISILIDYYMGDFSPFKKEIRPKLGDKEYPLDLGSFMDCLVAIVRGTDLDHTRPITLYEEDVKWLDQSPKQPNGDGGEKRELPEPTPTCRMLLMNQDMWPSLLKQGYNLPGNMTLCTHLSWDSVKYTAHCVQMLFAGVIQRKEGELDNLVYLLERMLAIEDSLAKERCKLLLSPSDGWLALMHRDIERGNHYFVLVGINLMIRLMKGNTVALDYLLETKNIWWRWMEPYFAQKNLFGNVSHPNTLAELKDLETQMLEILNLYLPPKK